MQRVLLLCAGLLIACGEGPAPQLAPVTSAPTTPARPTPTQVVVTATPVPEPTPTVFEARIAVIGTPYAFGGWEYTVTGVQRTREVGAGSLKSTAKGEWFIVRTVLKNLGRQNFGITPDDFGLYDGVRGVTYSPAPPPLAGGDWVKANGYEHGLLGYGSAAQIPPGVPITYGIVFDVNPDARTRDVHLLLMQARTNVVLER